MNSSKEREQYKRIIMFLISLVSLLISSSAFACIWYWSYADIIIRPFFRKGNWLLIGIYALLLYIFTRIYGGYRIGYLKRSEVIYSAVLSNLLVNVITYLQISLIGRHFMAWMPMLLMTVLQILLTVIWAILAELVYRKLFPPHKMLLIYGNESAQNLVYKMNTRIDKYDICEAIDISKGLAEVFQGIDRYDAVIICDVKSEIRNKVLKYCFSHSVRTYLTPKISDTIMRGAETIHLFDTPLLLCRNQGLTFEQRLAKRTLDLVLSGVGFILAAPVMLAVSVAIKLYDRGPILYKQRRLTIDGKAFDVYKFRSMVVDAEKQSGPRLAGQNDKRITPIGKMIRKIRLDELPQLLNILKGDMSIVGPRPERPEIAQQYENGMPEFSYRLKVKAGLTGYAQVLGKYNTIPYDKLKMDLMYIENYSFILDLKLILMTMKILFVPESTEGLAENQKLPVMPSDRIGDELVLAAFPDNPGVSLTQEKESDE